MKTVEKIGAGGLKNFRKKVSAGTHIRDLRVNYLALRLGPNDN